MGLFGRRRAKQDAAGDGDAAASAASARRLRRLAARLVVFGFDGDDAAVALRDGSHAARMVDAGCGGAILFARNVKGGDRKGKVKYRKP